MRKRLLAHDWLESWARVFFHSMFSFLSKMPLIDLEINLFDSAENLKEN